MAEAELCGPGDALGDSCCAVGAGAAEGGSLAASTSASASALVSAPASAPAPPKTNGVGCLLLRSGLAQPALVDSRRSRGESNMVDLRRLRRARGARPPSQRTCSRGPAPA